MKLKKETTTTITRDCVICANEYSYDASLAGMKKGVTKFYFGHSILDFGVDTPLRPAPPQKPKGGYKGWEANRFICSDCCDYLINYPDTLSCVHLNESKIMKLELMVEKLNDQLDREVALRSNKPRIHPIWTCLAFGFSVAALLAASHINIWGWL